MYVTDKCYQDGCAKGWTSRAVAGMGSEAPPLISCYKLTWEKTAEEAGNYCKSMTETIGLQVNLAGIRDEPECDFLDIVAGGDGNAFWAGGILEAGKASMWVDGTTVWNESFADSHWLPGYPKTDLAKSCLIVNEGMVDAANMTLNGWANAECADNDHLHAGICKYDLIEGCAEGWTSRTVQMNGYPQTSCYKLNKKNTTAEEAQKNCRHMSPMIGLPVNLASINDEPECDFLDMVAGGDGNPFWAGAILMNYENGTMECKWLDGTPWNNTFAMTHWLPGSPKEFPRSCLIVNEGMEVNGATLNGWDNDVCNNTMHTHPSICKYDVEMPMMKIYA